MTEPSARRVPARVDILGVPVDSVTMSEAIDAIGVLVETGRRDRVTHQVATVNVDFVVNAVRDPRLRDLMQRTDLSVADGMPIVWGARLCGTPFEERVTGADLIPLLARTAAARGWSMYLFGASPAIVAEATDRLRAEAPGLTINGDSGGIFREVADTSPEALERIRGARPDIVCVALGNPKQEWWIDHFRATLGVPVMIGIGGTLDLLVGDKQRAPAWMQRAGLEWIYRAAQEPGRLVKRYALDLYVFVPRMVVQVAKSRRSARRR